MHFWGYFLGDLLRCNTVPARATLDGCALVLGWGSQVIHKNGKRLQRLSRRRGAWGERRRGRLAAELGGRLAGPRLEGANKAFLV